MKQLIDTLKNALDCPLYAMQTDDVGECVIYNFHTLSQRDGIQRIRLQTTIIAHTMMTTLTREEIIKSAILTLGDCPFDNDILQVAANGGGTLYDDARQMQHRIIYFDIIKRGA